MTCPICKQRLRKHGKTKAGRQRYRCTWCGTTTTENHNPLGAMRVPQEKAVLALQMLVEGTSIRSAERVIRLHRDTIMSLLQLAGKRSVQLMDNRLWGLPCKRIQTDEIWCFVKKKQKNVLPGDPGEYGDQYCFVAMDPDSKLVPSFRVGPRTGRTATMFMADLRERMADTIQLTTDAFLPYLDAVKIAFEDQTVHYAQVSKQYHAVRPGPARYSPPRITGIWKDEIYGRPNRRYVSTSLIERQNLTIRMQSRRFTRLTNAFSKTLKNLQAAVALHFAHYNFCRIHGTIKKTPAMAAGVTDHKWSIWELLQEAATLT